MDAKKIKVVRVGTPAGAVGTPEDFEKHFERRQSKRRVVEHRPTLTPIENKSLQERLDSLGIENNS